jgi:MFS family permease
VAQGFGAALMMATSIAIVTAVHPRETRGRALGILADASAFFAALGPVLGGLLTEFVDWRAVFFTNVPLALLTMLLTFTATPPFAPDQGTDRALDVPGVLMLATAIASRWEQSPPWARSCRSCSSVGRTAWHGSGF